MSTTDFAPVVTALGIRLVRVPDLPTASILLARHRIALVDTTMGDDDWEDLLDAVLKAAADYSPTKGAR